MKAVGIKVIHNDSGVEKGKEKYSTHRMTAYDVERGSLCLELMSLHDTGANFSHDVSIFLEVLNVHFG